MITKKAYKKAYKLVVKYEKQVDQTSYSSDIIKKLDRLILKLYDMIHISESGKAKDAYSYVINELFAIKKGYDNNK